MVETVVFLPVLVLVFLGMFYLKGLMSTKMRAVEAARYVTWENTWVAREGFGQRVAYDGAPNRGIKSDATLKTELQKLGLGKGLFRVRNLQFNGHVGESLSDYKTRVEAIPGRQDSQFGQIPAVLKSMLGVSNESGGDTTNSPLTTNPNDRNKAGDASSSSGGGVPSQDTGGFENKIWDLAGTGTFKLFEFMAKQTKWGDESDQSVLTAEVVYKLEASGKRVFVSRFITEKSSILSHPLNIKRSTDKEEQHRLAGDGTSCEDEINLGHIFDIWLLPTGEPQSARSGLRAAKCPFVLITELAKVVSFLSLSNPPPVRIPNGTTKEYPELDLPANNGVGGGGQGSGGGTGSGFGGGNATPPSS